MRIVREITEDEMVLEFIRAEVTSPSHPEYAQMVGGNLALYDGPLSDSNANALRREALARKRGYPRWLFGGIPLAAWKLAVVGVGELADLRHLKDDAWNDLTGGSRLVRDAAANADTSASPKAPDVLAVEGRVRNGESFPPIIALAENESVVPIILEGNTRAAAYVRALDPDDEVEAIVGYNPGLASWTFY
ncbi:MAG TPA: hypothetical protein VLK53_12320 [Gaiellaceae bacterium]|nr:hypothetical protein [Gaiellaceae bacterium]